MDVLRGWAVLGILVMNMQSIAMGDVAYSNPTAYGDLSGVNYWVWCLSHVLAEDKFLPIFSMLFGAGIVLAAERQERSGHRPAVLHYRRLAVLLAFGCVHAYLIWYGDILVPYALCGAAAYPLRRLAPRRLAAIGLLLLAVPPALSWTRRSAMQAWPTDEREEFVRDNWRPTEAMLADEVAARRKGWLAGLADRAPIAWSCQTDSFLVWYAWRAGGFMLIGMALAKLRLFDASLPGGVYAVMVAAAALVGVPLVLYGIRRNFEHGWDFWYSFFIGYQYNYWASLLVSGGWIGLVMLGSKSPMVRGATAPLAAVGQMALTNYLLESVIATTIFYGHGLGLYDQVDRVGQMLIVAAVWAILIVSSSLWMNRFRFGPCEWLWRSLTYGTRQPMRRHGGQRPSLSSRQAMPGDDRAGDHGSSADPR